MAQTFNHSSRTATRWASVGSSIFAEVTALAKLHNAVNLGQGAPDFYGPNELLESISRQVLTCHNQYAPLAGEEALRVQVSQFVKNTTGVEYRPNDEITITNGASEAIYCAINAFVNPGDKVLIFEPAFDLYYQAIANTDGQIVPVRLHAPDTPIGMENNFKWSIDWKELEAVSAGGFSFVIFNSPHNPTGKIFTEEEIERIASLILKNNALVLTDEVYENLVFENSRLVSLCSIPKLQHLVLRVSSAAKTFGFTGLKTGWVCAPANLTQAIRTVHQATVFCVNPAIQLGLAEMMANQTWFSSYLKTQKELYEKKRNFLKSALERAGYQTSPTEGTFFITANYENLFGDMSSDLCAKQMAELYRVASIPLSAFYQRPPKSLPWLRFAFCKRDETLQAAADLLLK